MNDETQRGWRPIPDAMAIIVPLDAEVVRLRAELARVRVEVRAETLREVREATAEWLKLAAEATPGPWKVWAMSVLADPVGDSSLDTALPIADTTDPHRGLRTFNAQFIAASRAAADRLAGLVSVSPVAGEDAG